MNHEDIIKMAQKAGFEGCAELTWEDVICTEELVAFAKLVAQHEREACADMVNKYIKETDNMEARGCLASVAYDIRARGQE
jgi:hypothetical protein